MARVANLYSSSVQPVLLRQTWQSTIRAFSTQFQFDKEANYYSTLGLRPTATQAEIKKKFHELAKKYHPDAATSKPSDEERFKKITSAYDILSNDVQKRAYDAARNPQRQQQQASGRRGGGHEQDFASQWAKKEQTYTFNRGGESANQRTHAHGQQSYDEWKRTQKDDDKYNYFYHDARSDFTQDNRASGRRGDSYQTGSQQQGPYKQQQTYSTSGSHDANKAKQGGLTLLSAYAFLGLVAFQLILSIFQKPPKLDDPLKKMQAQSANRTTLPAGRSAGSISALYSGIDQQLHQDARTRTDKQKSEATDRKNELALRNKVIKPEKVIKVHTKKRHEVNPADAEIQKLRKEGQEVPRELLEQKFAHNRARHSRDLVKMNEYLKANYDMQEAFLRDIEEINRIQAEQGLPTISSSSAAKSSSSSEYNTSTPSKTTEPPVQKSANVIGKILKPPGHGPSQLINLSSS